MNGRFCKVSKFASEFRKALFMEHFGFENEL